MAEVADVLRPDPGVREGGRDVPGHDVPPASRRSGYFVQVCIDVAVQRVRGRGRRARISSPIRGRARSAQRSPDGRFTVIEVECLGACGFATPISDRVEDVSRRRDGGAGAGNNRAIPLTASPFSSLPPLLSRIAHGFPSPRDPHPRGTVVLSQYFGDPVRARSPAGGSAAGISALEQALAMWSPPRSRRDREGLGASRAWGRGLPAGHPRVVHEAGRREAALPVLQR